MDKFSISQLRDYFLKTNDVGVSYKDLSKEDLTGLAILSVFDKKGKSVQTSKYTYERPDGVITQNEFNITQKEYEKLVKGIYKELKKEVGKDISEVKIPTYSEMQAMLKDNKIDFSDLHLYARSGIAKNSDTKRPDPVLIPQKTATNELSNDKKLEFLLSIENNPQAEAAYNRVDQRINLALREGTVAYDFTGVTDDVQADVDAFVPDNDAAYNIQVGLDGEQYNDNGQRVTRINNHIGAYEKYKYDSTDPDAKYTEMMRYNGNGYKTDYFKRQQLKDSEGRTFEGVVIYHLDENENVCRITYPEGAVYDKIVDDFNDYNSYARFNKYYDELEAAGALD